MDSKQMNSIEIEETAAVWLARRDRSEWSEADEAELTRWLQVSTAHRVAFIRLEAMWGEANRLKALGAGVRPGVVPQPGAWRLSPFLQTRSDDARFDASQAESVDRSESVQITPAPFESSLAAAGGEGTASSDHGNAVDTAALMSVAGTNGEFMAMAQREGRSRSFTRTRAMAASVLVATALGVGWYLWPSAPAYRTPIGGVEAFALSDGSSVTLNTNSEIRVDVTDKVRRIDLKQGEAFFDVAKDPARPFVVNAGGQQVVAVGTRFSVRRVGNSADEVRVVVTEGRVRVGPVVAEELPPAEVGAGSIARTGGAGVLIQDKPARPVDEYLSWRRGYLVFRETALADAIAEFNRYNTIQLVIEDPAVAAIKIGGNFRSTNVDAFVRLIEDGLAVPVHAERRGEQIVLVAD